MEDFEDSANDDQERQEAWEAGAQELKNLEQLLIQDYEGSAKKHEFTAVMSYTGFLYQDWGEDFWKVSLDIQTGIETSRITVLISRLVARL